MLYTHICICIISPYARVEIYFCSLCGKIARFSTSYTCSSQQSRFFSLRRHGHLLAQKAPSKHRLYWFAFSAMIISGVIMMVVLVCYCCHKNVRKHRPQQYSQYNWRAEPDVHSLEVFTMDAHAMVSLQSLLIYYGVYSYIFFTKIFLILQFYITNYSIFSTYFLFSFFIFFIMRYY